VEEYWYPVCSEVTAPEIIATRRTSGRLAIPISQTWANVSGR
jgi:hypothetical protein